MFMRFRGGGIGHKDNSIAVNSTEATDDQGGTNVDKIDNQPVVNGGADLQEGNKGDLKCDEMADYRYGGDEVNDE